MLKVYKYAIPIVDEFYLELPCGAQILSVQVQRNQPCIWALVNPQEHKKSRRLFRFAGTGHPISSANLLFIGTFQMDNGAFVFHLFEMV